jgi:hypothetical protein
MRNSRGAATQSTFVRTSAEETQTGSSWTPAQAVIAPLASAKTHRRSPTARLTRAGAATASAPASPPAKRIRSEG